MILGTGIDLVEVARFEPWIAYSSDRLLRVFTAAELEDCRDANGALIAEKLAVRYAAKEAFYKAFSATLVSLKLINQQFGLLALAPMVFVRHDTWGVPTLAVAWEAVERLTGSKLPVFSIHTSLSHERTMAAAVVVIEKSP
jgi:holo-[acyl-carrier protein] synthase